MASRPAAVKDVDHAAAIADQPLGLQRAGHGRDRGALDAQHVGEEFLGQVDGVAVDAVAARQQPAAEAGLDAVQGVAGHRLDRVAEQRLVVAVDQVAQGGAAGPGVVQGGGADPRGVAGSLDDGPHQRLARRHGGHQAQGAFAADRRGLDRRAVLHQGHQRDDAVVREVDGLDRIARDRTDGGPSPVRAGLRWGAIRPKSSVGRAASRRFFKVAAVPSSESITGMR
jgi:hypothetical protein